MTTANIDQAKLEILQHALGLDPYGRRAEAARNYFVTGSGSVDHSHCLALVGLGYMTRRTGSALTGGDDIFYVTGEGRDAANAATPKPTPLSRSQRRYLAFLAADSGLTFGEWLKTPWSTMA